MPVIFGPYLERARERVIPDNDTEETEEPSDTSERPVRTVALGVALGVALAWLYRRRRS